MQIVFAGICYVGAIAAMLLVKSLDLFVGLKIAIVIALVCLVLYSLARIRPRKAAIMDRDAGSGTSP